MTLWYRGDEVLRVTGRKNQWGEVEEFICNTCRFETKQTGDWTIEGPAKVSHQSVISANHYEKKVMPEFGFKQAKQQYKLIDDLPLQLPEGQEKPGAVVIRPNGK